MSFKNSRSVYSETVRGPEVVHISSSSGEENVTDYLNIAPPQYLKYQDSSSTKSHHRQSQKGHKKEKYHSHKERHHKRKYLKLPDDSESHAGLEGRYYRKRAYNEENSVNIQHERKRVYSDHKGDVSRSCRQMGNEPLDRKSDRVKRHKSRRHVRDDGVGVEEVSEQQFPKDHTESEEDYYSVKKSELQRLKENDILESVLQEKLRMCVDEGIINIGKDGQYTVEKNNKNCKLTTRENRTERKITIQQSNLDVEDDHPFIEESIIHKQNEDMFSKDDHLRGNSVTISDTSDNDVGPDVEKDTISCYSNPSKRNSIESEDSDRPDQHTTQEINEPETDELLPYYPAIQGCRSVNEFQLLNHVDEGTYGVVYRAIDKGINEIVALKRLKMEKEREGFPITSLREINTLLKGQHPNIVTVREIVVGNNMDKIYIVMDYLEHDLKSLMENMRLKSQTFNTGRVKCLLKQLLCAIAFLHDNWILHRDLKPSNLLVSSKGILKVGDFGLAREYGSPLKAYTPVVVTLWYRAPELLLCTKQYSTAIDVWSIGCIFGELHLMNAIFPGKSEVEQLNKIFKALGTPDETIWPGFNKLPAVQRMKFIQYFNSSLKTRFHTMSVQGYTLFQKLLTYDPVQRITAEKALQDSYFCETPLPVDPSVLLVHGAESVLHHSPNPIDQEYSQLLKASGVVNSTGLLKDVGFRLKF